MGTITRTVNGRRVTTKTKESFSEFKKRQRSKVVARRRAASIRSRGGKAFVETIGDRSVVVEVKAPEIVEEISRRKTSRGTEITGFTRADIVKRKSLRQQQRKQTTKQILSKLPSSGFVSSAVKGQVPKKSSIRIGETKVFQKEKGFVQPVKLSRLQETERKLIGITDKPSKGVTKRTASAIALGGVGIVKGVVSLGQAIKNPKKFAKEQIEFAKAFKKNPKQVSSDIVSIIKQNPTGFIAEFWAFNKAAGLTGKGVRRTGASRFVQEEAFIRSQPKELQKTVRAVLKTAKVQEKINPSKSKKVKVNFAEVSELNKLEASVLRNTLKNDPNSFVFGSVAARTFSQGKTKIPKDVDLATKNVADFNKRFFDNLPKAQRSNYKVKGEKIIRVSDNTPILDVKPAARLIPEKGLITRKGRLPITGEKLKVTLFKDSQLVVPKLEKKFITEAFTPTQKIQKVGGIRLVGFGEQTTRKALGTLQVLLEKNVRRAKDPAAFVESIEIQLSSLKKSKPKTALGKILKKRKVKKLEAGLKVLKSKQFIKLLDKKVPTISKEFPVLTKIDKVKLKKVQDTKQKLTPEKFLDEEFSFKVIGGKQRIKPKLEKPSRIPSRVPSKVPSRVPSKIPPTSILKRFKASDIKPSKTPTKIIKSVIKPSKTPSKPSIVPSKIPISKIPVSIIPSRVPSKIPVSKLPKFVLSKLPITKKSKKPIGKVFKAKKISLLKPTKKKIVGVGKTFTEFTTTITRPEGKKRGKGLRFGDVELFTGAELR